MCSRTAGGQNGAAGFITHEVANAMRARNIKPSFFSSPDLGECSPVSRLCFAGLWCCADREGRLLDRPKFIKSQVFPYDNIDVEPLLNELEHFGLIERYEADGVNVISIPKFAKHQRPHVKEKPSELPEKTAKTKHQPRKVRAPTQVGASNNQGSSCTSLGDGKPALNPECGILNPECGMRNEDKTQSVPSPTTAWIIPDKFDTPRIRELLDRFEKMRKRIKKPIKDFANASLVLKRFDDEDHLAYALETCLANDYQGLKPDYRPNSLSNGSANRPITFAEQRLINSKKAMEDFLNG
jgi:hypothetical protein